MRPFSVQCLLQQACTPFSSCCPHSLTHTCHCWACRSVCTMRLWRFCPSAWRRCGWAAAWRQAPPRGPSSRRPPWTGCACRVRDGAGCAASQALLPLARLVLWLRPPCPRCLTAPTPRCPCPHLLIPPPPTPWTPGLQVEDKVRDALAKGATAVVGGGRPRWEEGSPLAGGFFFEPTVLVGEPEKPLPARCSRCFLLSLGEVAAPACDVWHPQAVRAHEQQWGGGRFGTFHSLPARSTLRHGCYVPQLCAQAARWT